MRRGWLAAGGLVVLVGLATIVYLAYSGNCVPSGYGGQTCTNQTNTGLELGIPIVVVGIILLALGARRGPTKST